MKKNKVILSISLAAALLFAAGCSANNTTSSSSSTESSKSTSTAESTTASSVDLNALELPQLTKDVAENEDLVEMVTNDADESEIVELEVYKLAMFSMETYARKFKAEGVEQTAMNELYDLVKNEVENIQTTSDKTASLKQEIADRFDSAAAAIENAFREQVSAE